MCLELLAGFFEGLSLFQIDSLPGLIFVCLIDCLGFSWGEGGGGWFVVGVLFFFAEGEGKIIQGCWNSGLVWFVCQAVREIESVYRAFADS